MVRVLQGLVSVAGRIAVRDLLDEYPGIQDS